MFRWREMTSLQSIYELTVPIESKKWVSLKRQLLKRSLYVKLFVDLNTKISYNEAEKS